MGAANIIKLIASSSILVSITMTDKLPPNLLALFAPRPPLRWVPPADHAPEERMTAQISGIASFLPQLQDYKENDVYEATESWLQRKLRLKEEKKLRQEKLLTEVPATCEGNPMCFDYLYLHLSEFNLLTNVLIIRVKTNHRKIRTFEEMLSKHLL